MPNTITFKHKGNTGDIIYALAGIRHVCAKLGALAKIVIWMDREGHYYDGAKHPLNGVMMNKFMFHMLQPLLIKQSYIESVEPFEGQKVDVDLDLIRQDFVNMPYGNISHWYFYRFPDMHCDTAKQWLFVKPDESWNQAVIVNRTERYRNPHIYYSCLRRIERPIFFVGTPGEYNLVKRDIPQMKYAPFTSFYDEAAAIAGCKVFIGNQSMAYGMAEAMKTPRILELCQFAPNVIPEGDGPGYGYYTQYSFEHYIKELTA